MATAASNIWGAVKSGAGALGRGLSSAASGIGSFLGKAGDFVGLDGSFGLSGPTGQPGAGLPGASSSLLSQGVPGLPNVAKGAGAPVGALGFSGPIADAGGGSVIDQILGASGSGGAPSVEEWIARFGSGSASGAAPKAANGGFNLFSRNTLENLIPALGIGYSVYRANQPVPGVENLRGVAEDARAQSQFLTRGAAEAMEGNLPGGAMSAVQQALRSAQASIRSNYANLGLTGSTMEAQDLAGAKERALAARFQIGQGLAATGLNAAAGQNTLASSLYQTILNAETAQGTEFGDALAAFAGLLAD